MTILAIMAIACAIADSELEKKYYPEGAPWLYADDQKNDNPSINGLVTWAFALITLVFFLSTSSSVLYADYLYLLASKTLSLYLYTFQSKPLEPVRLPSFILTRTSGMRRLIKQRSLGPGICPMIWVKLSISSQIRLAH